jgi:hypothetical protein
MPLFDHTGLRGSLICMVIAMLCVPTTSFAQEVTPFRLTGIDGYISLRYLFDEQITGETGGETSRQTRPTYEEQIFILTHSYIYHPNFLKLDLGGGPVFSQARFESDGEWSSSKDILYNYTGRLTLLENKPYPLVLYYTHLNPSVYLGLVERFLQENTRYGFNFLLRQPPSPVLLNIEAFRFRSEGTGFNRIVDETSDHAIIKAYRTFGMDDYVNFSYSWDRLESSSGSPNLPIQETTTTTQLADLNSRSTFGKARQFRFMNYASFLSQKDFVSSQTLRVSPDLRWDHSETLNSFYRYNIQRRKISDIDTTNQSATAGINHRLYQSLFTTFDIHGRDDRTTGLLLNSYGFTASTRYKKQIPYGNLQLHYSILYDTFDQQAATSEIQIYGEQHILSGVIPETLSYDNVIPSDVVVMNTARSQTFIEGIDYRLIIIGTKIQIQRIIGGNILDGETVLVDYAYQIGGTIKYTIMDQNYGINLRLFKYLNLFARFRNAPQRLISGTPTIPLNSVRSEQYGGNIDIPIWEVIIGGGAGYENHREDIAPYKSTSYDLFMQVPLPLSSIFRASGKRVFVDRLQSSWDTDLIGWGVNLQSYPLPGARLTAEARYEEDTGAPIIHRIWSNSVVAEWRIRQLILKAEGRYTREIQGDYERKISLINIELKREF